MRSVHLVGSVGLDTTEEVFAVAGRLLGPYLKRVPDGEPGGRRLWISWQYPLLRANPFLQVAGPPVPHGTGLPPLGVAEGVGPEDVRFGELGYAREARASYLDFCQARERRELPEGVKFQVSLPTPAAVINSFCLPDAVPQILPAYERAMLAEVERVCAAIPHQDLSLQWDVCIEMLQFDGHWRLPRFPGIEDAFRQTFARLTSPVPADVDLGIHLCYGDLDARHFVEPQDLGRAVELANLILDCAGRPLAYVHMPVPIGRADEAYFAPLTGLRRPAGTDLYLGLVHAADGVAGTRRRLATAERFVSDFGVASECGIARARRPEVVMEILHVSAAVAESSEEVAHA
jgi:hypothetical protein